MIHYRSFRNPDPPQLVKLWHACALGRGAAEGFTTDAFELLVFSQTYFDPAGLIVACDGSEIVGFVHAGFGCNETQSALDKSIGVICVAMVAPRYRRQGIGKELVKLAEAYLTDSGAQQIQAGASPGADPFYLGLYGGSQISGFLESDPLAAPFFESLGYQPAERFLVYQRAIDKQGWPVSMRLMGIRRKMEVATTEEPNSPTWWWMTHYGKIETLRFLLTPKGGGHPVANASIMGLDFYLPKWQERAIGLFDLFIPEEERRKGYGQTLILDVCRRMQAEMITRAEAHVPANDTAAIGTSESAGFQLVDTGVVYRRSVKPHAEDQELSESETSDAAVKETIEFSQTEHRTD